MTAQTPPAGLRPTQKRIAILDILRGFAIFGILVINITSFATAAYTPGYAPPELGWLDTAVQNTVTFLAEGKFYSLFSFLFGLGFALQMARAEAKGAAFLPLFLRRLFILLVIGVAHSLLLWDGDILKLYAVLGALLLLFRKAKPRTLLVWSGVFFLISVAMLSGGGEYEGRAGGDTRNAEEIIAIFSEGSYAETVQYRLENFGGALFGSVFQGVSVFAMFLLGLYAGKREFLADIGANRAVFRRWLIWGLVAGIPGNMLYL